MSSYFKQQKWLALGQRKLRGLLQLIYKYTNLCSTNSRDPYFWLEILIRYLWRRPFWYTDKFGVTLRRYPNEGLRRLFAERLHFDDEPMLEVVSDIVKKCMVVIDVGANYGQFTIFVAHIVGEYGHVHTFEPSSYAFHRLCENIHHLDVLARSIHPNQKAVGNHNGSTVLHEYSSRYSAWNSLGFHRMHSIDRWIEPSHTENVPIVTLDKYCEHFEIEFIDLLKIDVEGFELEVLQGCKRLISERRIGKIIFEISLQPLEGTNYTAHDILREVYGMGFDIYLIKAKKDIELVVLSQFTVPYFANYLAIPHDIAATAL